MKPSTQATLPLAALVGIALATGSADATVILTTAISGPNNPSTKTDEVAFAADVSSSDLLHGLTGTGGSWNANGSSPAGLNDGLPGGDYDNVGLVALTGAAWAKYGNGISSRDFVLPTTALGYNITGIQSIAAWQGAGFSNQKYEVRFRLVGEASFPVSPTLTIEYQPFSATLTEGGSTKVNVTDSTGVLASGVEAIRFTVLQTNSNTGGSTVFREIDVFGSAVPEPSAALLGLGGLALLCRRRRG